MDDSLATGLVVVVAVLALLALVVLSWIFAPGAWDPIVGYLMRFNPGAMP